MPQEQNSKVMNNTSFEALLDKYLAGSITEPESQLLSEMLNDPVHLARLEEIIKNELEEHAFEGEGNPEVLASIQHRIHQKIISTKKPARAISFYTLRIAVAAVFIILVGAGTYLLFNSKKLSNPEQPAVANNRPLNNILQPGGNKAVLRLADGKEILLDSAGTGTLAQQGQVKIIKLNNGQLSYSLPKGKSAEALYNTVTTPKGGQYQLLLADGSKIWLNAASALRFSASFSDKERMVELTGEGYFEIAKSPVPFHVKLNNVDIRVLGTHFDVNGYQDEAFVRTTLLEGSVKVTKGVQNTLLKPGQQASVSNGGQITVADNVEVERIIAWKNGLFQFKNTDLRTILREAARWYDVEFKYEGDLSETFSGQISRNVNASQLLKILESTGKVHFVITGRTILVKP